MAFAVVVFLSLLFLFLYFAFQGQRIVGNRHLEIVLTYTRHLGFHNAGHTEKVQLSRLAEVHDALS